MNRIKICVLGLVVAVLSGSAGAITVTNIEADWTSWSGGGSTVQLQTVGNEKQIRWGYTDSFFGYKWISNINRQSGLGIEGAAPPDITVNSGVPFHAATLRHYNKRIYSPYVDSATLDLSMTFSDPAGQEETFDFDFSIDETINFFCGTGDGITMPDTMPETETFTFNGTEYTVSLLGFTGSLSEPYNYVDGMTTPENGTSTAYLIAQVTESNLQPTNVPEPMTLVAVGSAIAGVGAYMRKRRSA